MKKTLFAILSIFLFSSIANAVPSNAVGAKQGGRVWYFDPSTFSDGYTQALVAKIDSQSYPYKIDVFVNIGGTITLETNVPLMGEALGSNPPISVDTTPSFVQLGSQISVIDPSTLPDGQPFPILVTSTNSDGSLNGIILNTQTLDSNGDTTYWTYSSVPKATGITFNGTLPCYLPIVD